MEPGTIDKSDKRIGGAILPTFDAIYNSRHFDFILPRLVTLRLNMAWKNISSDFT